MSLRSAFLSVLGYRDAAPVRMIGFQSDGGLVASGVTATTSLGLSAVWRCLDILANGVSQLPWQERRGNLELPPSRLIVRPQAERTRREWTSLVVSTLALYDVCYLLKAGGEDAEGVPMGLWPLDPSQVQPFDSDQYSILPANEYWVGQERIPRNRLVILHRSPQPGVNDTVGGVLKLARITFATAIAAENYASRYWQAGGPTIRALETDAALPGPAAQELSDRWAQKRAMGPDHVPVLTHGLKYHEYGIDPTNESAVEARRELVADISRYFGVPTRQVNAPANDHETYSSTEGSNLDLVRFTLRNYIGAIEDAISDQLPGGRRLFMDIRPLTHGTVTSMAQAMQLATGGKAWLGVDEAREEWGLAPTESPDELNPPPPKVVVQQGAPTNGG